MTTEIRYVPAGTTDLSTVTVDDEDIVRFEEGSQYANAGLAAWQGFTTGLHRIVVRPTFTGRVGGGGAGFLRCDIDLTTGEGAATSELEYGAGGGEFHFHPGGGSSLANKVRNIGAGSLFIGGGGTVTHLELGSGFTHVAEATVVTNMYQDGGKSVIQYNATGITEAGIWGGQATIQRSVSGTLDVGGGAMVTVNRETTGATMPTVGTLRIMQGTVKWKGGNITTLIVGPGGVFDASEANLSFTITTYRSTGKSRSKSTFDHRFVTITNDFSGKVNPVGTVAAGIHGFGGSM